MSSSNTKKLKTTAAGQYLGYALQPVRACTHLLTVPSDCEVSLEHIDDVAIHHPDGRIILEQTKSATSGNPANDRAIDLWKTLANWADICVSHPDIYSGGYFRYYVTPIHTGSLVADLHLARKKEQCNSLLNLFKTKKFQRKPGVGIEPHIQRFLNAGDDICLRIIERFEFLSEADPLTSMRQALTATLSEKKHDIFCEKAIGQSVRQFDRVLRSKNTKKLNADEFRKQFRAFVRKYDLSNLLVPTKPAPTKAEIKQTLAKLPLFVSQLQSVEATDSQITLAISDFLRSSADRVNWADDGDVVEDSYDELDEALVRHHTLKRDEVEDDYSHLSPKHRGRKLYRKCIELKHPLENKELPSYFISGEFNYLANRCDVGWHPDYEIIFGDDQ